jgi:hypothetical protein
LAALCSDLATRDTRVELRYVEAGKPSRTSVGGMVFRTFFVRHLIPLWFQFECFSAAAAEN